MSSCILGVDQDVFKVHIGVRDIANDIADVTLKGLSCVLHAHRKTFEDVHTPRSDHNCLNLAVLVQDHLMEGLV